jgi:hypothetical protein
VEYSLHFQVNSRKLEIKIPGISEFEKQIRIVVGKTWNETPANRALKV